MRRAAVAVLALAMLACGSDNVLPSGTVTAKDHDEPSTVYVPGVCIAQPKGAPICTPAQWIHHDESWSLRIEAEVGGDQVGEWHDVSQAEHDRIAIGDMWEAS